MAKLIQIYTDGSADCKTRCGAWAFIVVFPDGKEERRSMSYDEVTNNKMELMAVIEALYWIVEHASYVSPKDKQRYEIISDSSYVATGINEWRHTWRARRWKNVKNLPLWLAIETAMTTLTDQRVELTVSWTRGHDGNEFNEKCDKLAHAEYKKRVKSKSDEVQNAPNSLPCSA